MKYPQIRFWALWMIGLLACRVSAGIPPTPTLGPTPTSSPVLASLATVTTTETPSPTNSSPSPTRSPTTQPSATPTSEPVEYRTTYTFAVDFDYLSHTAQISETIHYVNRTDTALREMLLIVEPARQEGVFTLKNIIWPGGLQANDFRVDGSFWYLPLAEILEPGKALDVHVTYDLQLPENGGALGYTARQVNFGDWYPYVPPYRTGTGWLAYKPAAVGEHLNYDKADFNGSIQVFNAPPAWHIVAPGEITQTTNAYQFQWLDVRSFAWTGSEQYVLSEDTLHGVHIKQYTFPNHQSKGEYALGVIGQAVSLYSELFGLYPHEELLAVEGDFFDGMEYDGLFFLGEEYFVQHDGTSAGYLTALSAHETAHQWWYGVVANDQAWEPWLDEALCTYSEYLYYERYAPTQLAWWWEFRSDRFLPQGWVNSTIYEHTSFRSYVDAVYLRGAHFLHELRTRIGDEIFFAALHAYAEKGTGQMFTSQDFFTLLDEFVDQPYQDILDIYFRSEP